ncbi:MAG: glycosyltransferase [Methyloceanibacter sp.]|uniref:glycosyltransferase family 2 protein n=1 Tax=Methyloceanibacter sp. TaxID=1965321 RepID=UPI001DFA2FD5|nr:glycosyltransferase family 2 protein [Methyloceanibacter sp.]MCB1442462.1 glycosyltransferase [Methyloceanibacter sp.]
MSLVESNRAGSPRDAPTCVEAPLSAAVEYGFLLGTHIDHATLSRACAVAREWGVYPHEVLIAEGRITEDSYVQALAETAGVPYRADVATRDIAIPRNASFRQCLSTGVIKEAGRARAFLLGTNRLGPFALRALLARHSSHRIALCGPRALRRAIRDRFSATLARGAVQTLAERRPHLSAHRPVLAWQVWTFALGCAAVLAAGLTAPLATVHVATIVLACVFVPVILLRLVAAFELACTGPAPSGAAAAPIAGAKLPIYTILAPLYREAHMLPLLLNALARLEWPAAKLDIKLILEAADIETVRAAHSLTLPPNVEIVVVPDIGPRTKPKALNYALPFARGEYLVVYDAEDRPEPGQLRRAYDAFRNGPANLATVQARLNLYNADTNWLTRQFTVEYSALFDGLLPVLDKMQLPIPLGGTSNHFRVAALKWLLAWDPYNVTEDADLGTRLARCGYRCAVIGSSTYEEAPARLGNWTRQRTRWLKGFVQTWLVHMRAPRTLWRELGPRGFLAFQIMIGGTILSALVHPWFYVLLAIELAGGGFLARPDLVFGLPFWAVSVFSLVGGYTAAMALGFCALRQRRLERLLWQVPLMPVYWLLISVAAYRALWQFARAPFMWEKTDHGTVMDAPKTP